MTKKISDEVKHNYFKIVLASLYVILETTKAFDRVVLDNLFVIVTVLISLQFGVDLLKVNRKK